MGLLKPAPAKSLVQTGESPFQAYEPDTGSPAEEAFVSPTSYQACPSPIPPSPTLKHLLPTLPPLFSCPLATYALPVLGIDLRHQRACIISLPTGAACSHGCANILCSTFMTPTASVASPVVGSHLGLDQEPSYMRSGRTLLFSKRVSVP